MQPSPSLYCMLVDAILVLLIFLLNIDRHEAQVPLADYQCGTDITTRFLSNLMTSSCDQNGINICCIRHDECYSTCAIPQLSCDATFCSCIATLDASIYCRNVVYAWHCNAVQWLGDRFICPQMGQPLFGGEIPVDYSFNSQFSWIFNNFYMHLTERNIAKRCSADIPIYRNP